MLANEDGGHSPTETFFLWSWICLVLPALKSIIQVQTKTSEARGSAERHFEVHDEEERICIASVGNGGLLRFSFMYNSYE